MVIINGKVSVYLWQALSQILEAKGKKNKILRLPGWGCSTCAEAQRSLGGQPFLDPALRDPILAPLQCLPAGLQTAILCLLSTVTGTTLAA